MRVRGRPSIWGFGLGAMIMAGFLIGVAGPSADGTGCTANLHFEPAVGHASHSEAFASLAEHFSRQGLAGLPAEQATEVVVSEAAAALSLVAAAAPDGDGTYEYVVAGIKAGEFTIRPAYDGWAIDHVSVVVPAAVCDELLARSRSAG